MIPSTEEVIQSVGAKVAPRITIQDVESNIVGETYFTAADGVLGAYTSNGNVYQGEAHRPEFGLLTICILILKNGFMVTGESACASPANFNLEVGRLVARQNALNKVWPLMGYELKSQLANQ